MSTHLDRGHEALVEERLDVGAHRALYGWELVGGGARGAARVDLEAPLTPAIVDIPAEVDVLEASMPTARRTSASPVAGLLVVGGAVTVSVVYIGMPLLLTFIGVLHGRLRAFVWTTTTLALLAALVFAVLVATGRSTSAAHARRRPTPAQHVRRRRRRLHAPQRSRWHRARTHPRRRR